MAVPHTGARVIDARPDMEAAMGRVIEPGHGDPPRPRDSAPVVLVAWPRVGAPPVRSWVEVAHLRVIGSGAPASN